MQARGLPSLPVLLSTSIVYFSHPKLESIKTDKTQGKPQRQNDNRKHKTSNWSDSEVHQFDQRKFLNK